jgi:hypothetical protein
MRIHNIVAAAIVSASLFASAGPAGAGLTANALQTTGSAVADLNGVAVEAATPPRQGDKTPSLREALEGDVDSVCEGGCCSQWCR